MPDVFTKDERSRIMSLIKSADTKPEILVRKALFSKGYRYRKNDKRYPGKPDILLPKYKTAIFVHGCFWHHHDNCKYASTPKSNKEYWDEKFAKNKMRDVQNEKALNDIGFHVIIIWECEIKTDADLVLKDLIAQLEARLLHLNETIQNR